MTRLLFCGGPARNEPLFRRGVAQRRAFARPDAAAKDARSPTRTRTSKSRRPPRSTCSWRCLGQAARRLSRDRNAAGGRHALRHAVFTPDAEREIKLECRWACGLRPGASVWRDSRPAGEPRLAGGDAAARAGRSRSAARRFDLVKRIPAAAGLGGASSDAAAALVAANVAWQLDWPRERLAELAAELGSDVPFFLTRGAAVCRGRGERIESLPPAGCMS